MYIVNEAVWDFRRLCRGIRLGKLASVQSDACSEGAHEEPGADWYSALPQKPVVTTPEISRQEFDALKRDVQELKALLKRAKEYDERTGQPDCGP